jgi:hypothetical protein
MATTTEAAPADSKQYVDYEEYVDFQLEKTRSSIKLTDIFTTLTTLAVAVISYLLVFVLLDQWVLEGGFGYTARVVLLGILLAGVLGTLGWRVIFPLLRRVHPLYAASVIESSDPNLKSNLVNFVDVRQSNMPSAPVVLKAMEKRAAVELSHIDVEEAVDRRPLLRIAYGLLGVVVVCALYIIFSPKDPFASVRRALLPTADIAVATETTISEVKPGDDAVPARTIVVVSADIRGKDADAAQLLFTTADHQDVNHAIEMKREDPTLPRFSAKLNGENGKGLLQSLTYRIVAGDAQTRDYAVTVIQSPSARVDEVHYAPPAYMQLESRTTSEANIDGWEGTAVTVRATANMPVKSARVVLTDSDDPQAKGEEYTMQINDGTKLSVTWTLERRSDGTMPRFYHVAVTSEKGEDPEPTQHSVLIRPDQQPQVTLLAPTSDLVDPPIPANGIIPLIIQAADPDFQVRSIALKAERRGENILDKRLFDDRLPAPTFQGNHDFALAPLKLSEGDTIQFWIEAKDNKQPTANRGASQRVNVKVGKPASAREVQDQLAEEKKRQQDQIKQAENQLNPDRPDNPPPPEAGAEDKPEKQQQRPEPGDADERRAPENRANDNEPESAPDKHEQKNQGQQKKQEPATEQEALRKLLQKEQEQQQNGGEDRGEEQKPQPAEKNTDKNKNQSNKSNPGREQGNEKQQGKTPQNGNQTGTDAGQQSEKPSDGKNNSKEGNRAKGKNQQPADKSPSKPDGNKAQEDQPKGGSDDNRQSQQEDANRENTGGAGKAGNQNKASKPDGDQTGGSAKSDDPKNPQEDGQNATGEQNPGKSKNTKKPGTEKQPGAEQGPGDKQDPSKKTDGAKPNAGNNDQTGDDPGAKDPGTKAPGKKSDGDKGNAGNEDKSNPGAKEPGTKDPGNKNDPGKEDGSDKTGDQGDNKSDPSQAGKSGTDSEKPGEKQSPTEQKNQPQGGAGKKSDQSDPAGNSNDPQKAKGSSGDADKPEGDPQRGDGRGKKSQKSDGDNPKQTKNSDGGKEEPADDSPDAVKKKADGTEKGPATGDKDGDPQAPKAGDGVKKKEGSEDGAKGSKSDGDPEQNPKKSGDKRKPDEGTAGSSADPDNAERQPPSKEPKEGSVKPENRQSPERPDLKKPNDQERRPGQPPDIGNEDLKGPGRKEGQKSEQPQGGEKGSTAASDQGKPGANQKGPGDKSKEPGDTDPASKDGGKPGTKKGEGSTTRPTDKEGENDSSAGKEQGDGSPSKGGKEPGQKGGKPGDQKQPGAQSGSPNSEGPDGKEGNSADGKSGEKGDQPGAKPGSGNQPNSSPGQPGKSGNKRSGGGISGRPGEGPDATDDNGGASDAEAPKARDGSADDEPPSPEEEQANLEFAKKATNLVLNRLKGQLERGEVDQKLLDELGWKDQKDLERLVQFLEQGLNQRDDDSSPEAVARRLQFEETLKSLRLGNQTGSRSGGAGTTRRIRSIDNRNVPVPPEYRKLYESYTRSLSKTSEPAAKKK